MNSRPCSLPLLLAATLALGLAGFPALGQETRNPAPPAPPATPAIPRRPPDPEHRPLGGHRGERRGGFRDEWHEGRMEPRRDGQRGPEEGHRPDEGPRRDGERGPGSAAVDGSTVAEQSFALRRLRRSPRPTSG